MTLVFVIFSMWLNTSYSPRWLPFGTSLIHQPVHLGLEKNCNSHIAKVVLRVCDCYLKLCNSWKHLDNWKGLGNYKCTFLWRYRVILSTEKKWSFGQYLVLQLWVNDIKILIPYCLFFHIEADVRFFFFMDSEYHPICSSTVNVIPG